VRAPTATPIRHVEQCMGTVFSFDIRGSGIAWDDLRAVLDWLHETDARFSTYRSGSEINRLADGRLDLTEVHPDVAYVLSECAELQVETGGYFSACADGRLDPSGYVKGWAVNEASRMLAAAGSTAHCVNGGGDISCHGRPSVGRGWQVGIADPVHPGVIVRTVVGAGPLGIATSGTSQRGAHIIDPHTGTRQEALASVTVVTDDVVRADVLATAAVAMGEDGIVWLAGLTDVRSIVVRGDGSVSAAWRGQEPT